MPGSFSLIIPCFNEEKNLPELFASFDTILTKPPVPDLEVIFVDDGSCDATPALLQEYASRCAGSVRVISYSDNRGKGYAVRTGMLAARGAYKLFLDADLAVSFDQVAKLLPYMERREQVIVGCRVLPGAVVEISQGLMRRVLGRVYTLLARVCTGVTVNDFTCGFKCFSAEAAQVVFSRAKIDRWSYDAEILYLAKRARFSIIEMPVRWRNGTQTQVRLGRDVVQSLVDLLRIRFIHSHR